MIFLLGGPPRVGKSIISGEIRRKHAVSVVSTDSLGAVLEHVLSPEEVPDLFAFTKFGETPMAERVELMTKDPGQLIEYVQRESDVVWRAVKAYAGKEAAEGRDVLIEGVAVLPELVGHLEDIPHRAVFVGNQGSNHAANIKRSVEDSEHDWMRGASDEYIGAFATFVQRLSATIEREAVKLGFDYFEIGTMPLGHVAQEVVASLGLVAR